MAVRDGPDGMTPRPRTASDSSALVAGPGTQPVVLVLGDAAHFPRFWALY